MKEQELKRKKPSYRADAVKVILILLTAIAVLAAGSWFLWTAVPDGGGQSQKSPFLSVKAIEVEGETRYDKTQIIEASGLFVGQSLLAVNKVQAYERIAAAFPYIESMEIQNRTVDSVCITVREATAAGAVYFDGGWLVVSAAGKGLEKLPLSSDRPPRLRYIKGAVLREDAGVGKASLDERSLAVIRTLTDGFSRYNFDEISEIDLSDLTDITFLMGGTLRVKLGSDGNLEQELEVLSTTIPKLKNTYGSKLRGIVDASSYSREGATARVVYTPQEVAEGNF